MSIYESMKKLLANHGVVSRGIPSIILDRLINALLNFFEYSWNEYKVDSFMNLNIHKILYLIHHLFMVRCTVTDRINDPQIYQRK